MEKVLIVIVILSIIIYASSSYKNYKANNEEASKAWLCAASMAFLLLTQL